MSVVRHPSFAKVLLSLILFLPLSRTAHTQNITPGAQQELVVLTATVKNRDGNLIMGVPREQFQLFDEKDPRTIELFESADVPLSIAILIDTSASMEMYQVKDVARAGPVGRAIQRLLELSNADNEYFLMTFDATAQLVADWSNAQALLNTKTTLTYQKKNTALYDACMAAMQKLQTAHTNRRVLIIVSDGQENSSRNNFAQLRESVKRSDIALYAFAPLPPKDVDSAFGMEGRGILQEVAEITGGAAFFPEDENNLQQAFEFLSNELRHQYRLGFTVAKSSDAGRWHRLKVKIVQRPNGPEQFSRLSVRTRPGYYGP